MDFERRCLVFLLPIPVVMVLPEIMGVGGWKCTIFQGQFGHWYCTWHFRITRQLLLWLPRT